MASAKDFGRWRAFADCPRLAGQAQHGRGASHPQNHIGLRLEGTMQAPRTTTPWAEEVKEHFSGPVHVSKDLAGILWRNSLAEF
jgi:hypothetical protein